MHSMLNTKPFWADLCVSWSGMLSNPTCPFRLRVRIVDLLVSSTCNTSRKLWYYTGRATLKKKKTTHTFGLFITAAMIPEKTTCVSLKRSTSIVAKKRFLLLVERFLRQRLWIKFIISIRQCLLFQMLFFTFFFIVKFRLDSVRNDSFPLDD